MQKHTLLVLGGCHIKGYPYKEEDSFVLKIDKFKDFQVKLESTFPIKRLVKRLDLLNGIDHVMLQLGHYETNYSLSDFLFGKRIAKKSESSINEVVMDNATILSHTYTFGIRFYFLEIVKLILQFIRDLSGKSLFDSKSIEKNLEDYFSRLNSHHIKNVTVLSAFYCPSFSTNIYRKRLNKILHNKSLKYGYQYLDVFSLLEKNTKSTDYYYFDNIHLSKNSVNLLTDFINQNLK